MSENTTWLKAALGDVENLGWAVKQSTLLDLIENGTPEEVNLAWLLYRAILAYRALGGGLMEMELARED